MTNGAYRKLCTEFYDLSKPSACAEELSFYAEALRNIRGPILEAMCGSGRLLLPLLKLGLHIDGVDNSSEMLESCERRCRGENLPVALYNQSIEALSLKNYAAIFIAVGSFQLISGRAAALNSLRTLHAHLLPGGELLLDTFIPWESLEEGRPSTISLERTVTSPNGEEILLHSTISSDPLKQLESTKNRYLKRSGGTPIASEEEELRVRWYYPYEIELLLEKAGFSQVTMEEQTFEHNPQSIIYRAKK